MVVGIDLQVDVFTLQEVLAEALITHCLLEVECVVTLKDLWEVVQRLEHRGCVGVA